MQNPILRIKEEQKERAKKIKKLKKTRPLKNRGDKQLWKIEMEIFNLSYVFRHNHIVYCEFNGRRREEIENNVREGNKANEEQIDRLKEKLYKEMGEYFEYKSSIYLDAA